MGLREKVSTIVLTAVVSGSLGYGASQTVLAKTVAQVAARQDLQDRELSHLKDADANLQALQKDSRDASDKHMAEVVRLFEKTFEQNQQFINLIKVSNELLIQQRAYKP